MVIAKYQIIQSRLYTAEFPFIYCVKWCTILTLQLVFAPCFWTKSPGKLGIIFARIGHKKQKMTRYFWKTSNLAITFNKTRRNMVDHSKKSGLETQEVFRYPQRRCERSDLYHFSIWFPTICRIKCFWN